MLYKSEDFSVGKTIEMSIGSNTVTYAICGFLNSVSETFAFKVDS